MGAGKILFNLALAGMHPGVHQGVEFVEAFRIAKNLGSQPSPVDSLGRCGAVHLAVPLKDSGAKFANHARIRLAIRLLDLAPQFVGLNQQATQIGQRTAHKALAASQSAGETYPEHACCSASSTVLLMSMAMVRGPTPPGTGL